MQITPPDMTDVPLVEAAPAPLALVPLAVAAVLAFVWAAALVAGRMRCGLPVVAPRQHEPVPWNGIDVLQVLLLFIAVMIVGGSGLAKDDPLGKKLTIDVLAKLVATCFGMAYLAARGATLRDLGFVGGPPRQDLGLALGALALVVFPLLSCAALLDRIVTYEHPIVDFLMRHRDPVSVGLVVLSAVVVAPLVEEFFFRRVLQGWLEKRVPADDGLHAIALASAFFSLAHAGQGLAFLPLFPLAMVLGYLARQTGTIVPSILLHALFNAVSVALLLVQTAPVAGAAG
jgi:membrane protease YdiL (CAAX protease family)